MADSARTALPHMDDQETDQIEAYHPEWDPSDDKYVPWSPAFKLRGSGVTIGKRAMMKDTNEPCEVVRQNQNNLSVHFPRKKEIVQIEESQLTPYDYTRSSGRTTSAVVTTEPRGKSMLQRNRLRCSDCRSPCQATTTSIVRGVSTTLPSIAVSLLQHNRGVCLCTRCLHLHQFLKMFLQRQCAPVARKLADSSASPPKTALDTKV